MYAFLYIDPLETNITQYIAALELIVMGKQMKVARIHMKASSFLYLQTTQV